jgi:uncharacterized membrane protein
MLAIGLFFFFFVHHSTERVVVLRKSVMILQIPLWLLAGMFFERNLGEPTVPRISAGFCAALIVLSLQTYVWDMRTFTAWNNPQLTAYVSQADYAACRWIVENTSSDSVIQAWISYGPDSEKSEAPAYSIIPELADRKTAVGIWEIAWYSRIEGDTPATRWKDIRDVLFRGEDPYEAWRVARKYNIDYVYIGAYEKKEAPEGWKKFAETIDIFHPVYEKDGIVIYEVAQSIGTEGLREPKKMAHLITSGSQ